MEKEEKNNQYQGKIFEEMMEAGVYYGRAKRYTHPLMKAFFLKTNKNIELFNLKHTLNNLNKAAEYLKNLLIENKTILFVGITPASQKKIKEIAEKFNQPYVNYKWIAGLLTNFQTVKARLIYFQELLQKESSGEFLNYFPKERSRLERELQKLKNFYSGVVNLEKLPEAVFIVNLAYPQHQTSKRESLKMEIPIISISGSDNNITGVKIFIPGNDKAPKSIAFLIDYLISKISAN